MTKKPEENDPKYTTVSIKKTNKAILLQLPDKGTFESLEDFIVRKCNKK